MRYLLDTDMLIYFLKGNPSVVKAFGQIPEEDLKISILSHSELLYGAFYSEKKNTNLKKISKLFEYFEILPYDQEASYIFAEQKAKLRQEGSMLMDFDLMIGSIALRNKLVLVTNNQKHFKRVDGLKLENWYKKDSE